MNQKTTASAPNRVIALASPNNVPAWSRIFGDYLLARRSEAKLSQRTVARRAHISQARLSRAENGDPPLPERQVVVAIAGAIGVDPTEALIAAGYLPDPLWASCGADTLLKLTAALGALPPDACSLVTECALSMCASVGAFFVVSIDSYSDAELRRYLARARRGEYSPAVTDAIRRLARFRKIIESEGDP